MEERTWRTSDVRNLLLLSTGRPTGRSLELLKAAKEALDVPFQVVPRRAFPGCSRFLAVGLHPEFVADYAYVANYDDPELTHQLEWVLTGVGFPRYDMQTCLTRMMGRPVKEQTPPGFDPNVDFEAERRFVHGISAS